MKRPLSLVVVAIAGIAALVGALTTRNDLTADKLAGAVTGTFGNLYVQQQAMLGRPGVSIPGLITTTSCRRRSTTGPAGGTLAGNTGSGAGDDWTCVVQWRGVAGVLQAAVYDTSLRANGCFTATGSSSAVGPAQLPDVSGQAHVNPLYAFDGCFDPS